MSDREIVEVSVKFVWAEQGGMSMFLDGERLVKSVDNEEQMALFIGGFLRAIRDPLRSPNITIPREDFVDLIDDRKKLQNLQRHLEPSTVQIADKFQPGDLNLAPEQKPNLRERVARLVVGA